MNEDLLADKVYGHLQKLLAPDALEKVVSLLTQKVSAEKGKVVVTLAQVPSEELKDQVGERIEKIFGPKSAIEYRIRPEIVGGFVLEGRGERYDSSLEKRIEMIFENGRAG